MPIPERGGDDFAVGTFGFFGKPLDVGRCISNFTFRLGQRLALLGGHQGGQIVLVFHHQIEPATQDTAAFGGGRLPPAFQCLLGSMDGPFGFGSTAARHRGDRGTRGGIDHGENFAAIGSDPGTIDITGLT